MEYGNLVAPIIEAIKELATRVEGLAGRVFNAETRLDALEKQNQLQADQIRELQRQILQIKETK